MYGQRVWGQCQRWAPSAGMAERLGAGLEAIDGDPGRGRARNNAWQNGAGWMADAQSMAVTRAGHLALVGC